jgi:hypothetical protein
MINWNHRACGTAGALLFIVLALSFPLQGQDRFQVEIQGGVSFLNPKDLNLFSRAEEQYNEIYFIQRHLGWQGYFLNDFPEISYALPAGVRVRYRLSERLSLSLGVEGFRRRENFSLAGEFSYSAGYVLTEKKGYDRFHLGLAGWSMLGGVHYRFSAGDMTELEVGLAAGWTRAEFSFASDWTYSVILDDAGYPFMSTDGGRLEGDGAGGGFLAQGMLRLSRALGRRFGIFLEASYTFSRLKSLTGSGRETRLGIPGETTWEGRWGIKREEIVMPYLTDSVLVPANYWAGWVAGQRERDFVLDLSALRMSLGLYLRF